MVVLIKVFSLFLLIVLIFCLSSGGAEDEVLTVGINHNAILSNEIDSIIHDIDKDSFHVIIKEPSLCLDPYLFLRLSGAALLAPKGRMISRRNFIFNYEVPINGLYHLEILLFGCNYNISTVSSMVENCVPLPPLMTINEPYNALLKAKRDNVVAWIAYSKKTTVDYNNTTVVKTRYQREVCYENKGLNITIPEEEKESCREETDRSWVSNYKLINYESSEGFNDSCSALVKKRRSPINVCFVGCSHSRYLHSSSHWHHINGVNALYIPMLYPGNWFDNTTQERFLNKSCTHTVLAVGQWPLWLDENSFIRYEGFEQTPLGVREFSIAMEQVIQTFSTYQNIQFFLRTIHFNALGYKKLRCPPTDCRIPYMIESYNNVLKTLSAKYKTPLIDTDWLIRPIWDSSKDYNHLVGPEMHIEYKFILHKVCSC